MLKLRIVVAERRPMVFSAIEEGLQTRGVYVNLVAARSFQDLQRLVRTEKDCVVVSGHLLPGFTTNEGMAKELKQINRRLIFVVYNGVVEQFNRVVDLRIPTYVQRGDVTIGVHIVDFLSKHVFGPDSGYAVQLQLF